MKLKQTAFKLSSQKAAEFSGAAGEFRCLRILEKQSQTNN
jgi:hypothetical protein